MIRHLQLLAGLLLYGVSLAFFVQAGLGLDPWDVFHEGVSAKLGLSFGTVVILVGALVLLLWVPLRQRPGTGTIGNVLLVGLAADAGLAVLPEAGPLPVAIAMLAGAIVLNAIAGAMYIGAGLGPGPRDGLMTGLVARTGRSVRLVRTSIELTVLAAGVLLGGTIGAGTIAYAVLIGPLLQVFLPRFELRQDLGQEGATGGDVVRAEAMVEGVLGVPDVEAARP